ncbi:MAG: response regulator [Deltaproteobacteria bacterium]|nr:response regulator [Deltaproteobacteria bacterium]
MMTRKSAARPHQILIVDDDPQIHRLLAKMLQEPTYHLMSAFSADDAYAMIDHHHPDMVILDIMMPKVSGIAVCNYIKSRPQCADIRVLILSAKDAQSDRLDGLQHGADDYIAKPFHMRHFLRKIEHMLAGKAGTSETEASSDDKE